MRTSAPLLTLALFWGLWAGGCTDSSLEEAQPRVCTEQACPEGWCSLTLSFDTSCSGLLSTAEVLLDGALEPGVATYGETFKSVGHIPKGEDSTFWVRGNDWQWKIEFTCLDVFRDGEYQLACASTAEATPVGGQDATDPGQDSEQ